MSVASYLVVNGQIISETRNNVESDYIADGLGSTAALMNNSGVITDTFTYWPFGQLRSHVGSSVTPFRFGGTLGYYSNTSGDSIYVRARYYRQTLMRWQTLDPMWPNQPSYSYSGANPSTFSDPSGLMSFKQCEQWCLEWLMTPLEACMYCSKTVLHYSQSASQNRCKNPGFVPKPIGPKRPGPIPRPPRGEWHDLPPFLGGILGACSYAMTSGTEPLGVIGGATAVLCGVVLPKWRNLEEMYCSGDDVASNRGDYPGATDLFWNNYCRYLDEGIKRWAGYCDSINK